MMNFKTIYSRICFSKDLYTIKKKEKVWYATSNYFPFDCIGDTKENAEERMYKSIGGLVARKINQDLLNNTAMVSIDKIEDRDKGNDPWFYGRVDITLKIYSHTQPYVITKPNPWKYRGRFTFSPPHMCEEAYTKKKVKKLLKKNIDKHLNVGTLVRGMAVEYIGQTFIKTF